MAVPSASRDEPPTVTVYVVNCGSGEPGMITRVFPDHVPAEEARDGLMVRLSMTLALFMASEKVIEMLEPSGTLLSESAGTVPVTVGISSVVKSKE